MKSQTIHIYERILNIFILFILIELSQSFISFNYPYGLTLSNGNILVIHQKGISITNKYSTKILKNVIIFSENEEITSETSLSKIATAFEYEYVISIINDKIYIFDENGTFLYNDTDKILSSGETAEVYALVPIKKDNIYYHYVIGYIHNRLLYFLYYKYEFSNKINSLITYRKGEKHKQYNSYRAYITSFYIENKALSCQYIKDADNYLALVCFFVIIKSSKYNVVSDYFLIEEDGISMHEEFVPDYYEMNYNITCIKTAISPDLSKILVGMYSSTGIPYFFIYDSYFQLQYRLLYFQNSHCRNQYHGLKVNYYKEKQEYIFSCIDDNGKILVEFFKSNLTNYNYTFKYSNCENIYGYSILFINNNQKYYILSAVDCNGIISF